MENENNQLIPFKQRQKTRKETASKVIRALYKAGYSMREICVKEHVSKTTVFFAIHGNYPWQRKTVDRKRAREKR